MTLLICCDAKDCNKGIELETKDLIENTIRKEGWLWIFDCEKDCERHYCPEHRKGGKL